VRFIRRLGATFLCYVLAAFVMCLAFVIGDSAMQLRAPKMLFSHEGPGLLVLGTYLAAIYSALPATPLIIASQLLRARRWSYFVLGGAVVGALIFALLQIGPPPFQGLRNTSLSFVFALVVAGSLAGASYRLMAGRLLTDV